MITCSYLEIYNEVLAAVLWPQPRGGARPDPRPLRRSRRWCMTC